MPFFSRPDLSDIQFKQLPDSELHLSGITYFMKSDGLQLADGSGNTIPIIATGATSGHVLTYINDGGTGKITLLPGGAGGDPLFDSHRSTTRVGIPDVTINGDTVKEFLEGYFFPAVAPTSSISAGSSNREFGDNSSDNLSVSVVRQTYEINNVGVDTTGDGSYNETPVTTPITGNYTGSFTYTYPPELAAPSVPVASTSISYKVMGQTTANETTTSSTTVRWRNRVFYFVDTTLYSATDQTTLEGIANGLNGSQAELATSRNRALVLTFNNEFFYYMYPKIFGEPSFAVNGLPNNAWGNPSTGSLFEITYVNREGYSSTYYIARSDNRITGDYTIQIT